MHERSSTPVGRTGHAACGLAGFGVAVVSLLVGWSVVVAATAWVPLLSTTALVLLAAAVWGVAWLVFESALVLARAVGEPGE